MAGPCSVESESQINEAGAARVRDAGAAVLRGGAFKPRTSPSRFQGLGKKGPSTLLKKARERDRTALMRRREVMTGGRRHGKGEVADILQVGAAQHAEFRVAQARGWRGRKRPVLASRRESQRTHSPELLLSAEYADLARGTTRSCCASVACATGFESGDAANVFDAHGGARWFTNLFALRSSPIQSTRPDCATR